jgi:Cu+-exporting ATPase
MHPEIRQPEPGNCPKCGMTLEPVMPAFDEEENPELRVCARRFSWSLPLTVILTMLAMAGQSLQLVHGSIQNWIELALATPVTLWAGWPFFVRGIASIRNRSPNMWALLGLGTAAAHQFSVMAALLPQFPLGPLRVPLETMEERRSSG